MLFFFVDLFAAATKHFVGLNWLQGLPPSPFAADDCSSGSAGQVPPKRCELFACQGAHRILFTEAWLYDNIGHMQCRVYWSVWPGRDLFYMSRKSLRIRIGCRLLTNDNPASTRKRRRIVGVFTLGT